MSQSLLFLCPHGVAKSVMAAAYASRFAREAGLELSIANAGTEPDEAIPAKVIDLLASDGFDVSTWQPRLVTQADLERADRVISLGCDLQNFDLPTHKLEVWEVTPPGQDLIACRNEVQARVKNLIANLG